MNYDVQPPDTLFDWPLFGLQDDVRPALADAANRGVPAVLATLYGVEGGAPRGVGAQMVITSDAVTGFLSGGCIEADLALHARRLLVDWKSRRLVYGEGGPADLRLPCGSRIDILLEPLAPDDGAVARLLEFQRERRPATWLTRGDERACLAADAPPPEAEDWGAVFDRDEQADQICRFLRCPFVMGRTFAPQRRLLVIGGDPIALAVAKLASEMGLETILIRPRGPETCPLAGVHYDRAEAGQAIARWRPDAWTAIAVLTHDVSQEQEALEAALCSKAAYVGALGSRRRVPDRIARLEASGVSTVDIARVHGPIGLQIGGKSPLDIALSVVAEVVSEFDAVKQVGR